MELETSTEKEKIDLDFVHRYLSNDAYWAKGRTKEAIKNTIDNSFCIGAFHNGAQVGFARVVTDFQTLAYVMDVFVDASKRHCGVGTIMIEALLTSQELKCIQRFTLATVESANFYEKLGFKKSDANYLILEQKKA